MDLVPFLLAGFDLKLCTCLFQAGSERNYSRLTFDGVDLMGERLAEEVIINNQQ